MPMLTLALKKKIELWLNDWVDDPLIRQQLFKRNLITALSRCEILSILFAILFGVYGFTSLGFLHVFDPNISLLENTLPRIIFNSIPFLLIGQFISKSSMEEHFKVNLWLIGFVLIFQAACWVNVWPLVLKGHSELILYVGSANLFCFTIVPSILMLPNRYIIYYYFYLIVGEFIPLLVVVHLSKNEVIFWSILNDLFLAVPLNAIAVSSINRLRSKVATIEKNKSEEKNRFLHPLMREAKEDMTYLKNPTKYSSNDNKQIMLKKKRGAFLLNIDIRGFTELRKQVKDMDLIQCKFQDILAKHVQQNMGTLQKAMGDGYIAYFTDKSLDADTDLDDIKDIPSIAQNYSLAKNNKKICAARNAVSSFESFYPEIKSYFSSLGLDLYLGAAIDYGQIFFDITSKGDMEEVEFFGDVILRSDRLQKFTKKIIAQDGHPSTILILSSDTQEFYKDDSFEAFDTSSISVDNYKDIECIYIKKFYSDPT